jgi:hypothetical protein
VIVPVHDDVRVTILQRLPQVSSAAAGIPGLRPMLVSVAEQGVMPESEGTPLAGAAQIVFEPSDLS